MNFDPTDSEYPLYETQLAIARRKEKRMMLINCSKLGALLLIYVIMNRLMLYPFYVLSASVHSGSPKLLVSDAIQYLRENQDFVNTTGFSMCGNLFVVVMSVIIVLILARTVFRVNISEMMRPRAEHIPQGLRWMPMCLVINSIISIVVSLLQSYLATAGITIPESDFSIKTPTTFSIVMQFVYVILIGPLAEELIYRGLILTLLRPFGSWLAVFFSALIFGMMHGNIPQMTAAFASALVMGIIAVRTGSIIPTLIIHICNNCFASFTDFGSAFGWQYTRELNDALQILIYFSGIFIIMVFGRRLKMRQESYAMTYGQRTAAVVTNIPMMIYLGYLIFEIAKEIVEAN